MAKVNRYARISVILSSLLWLSASCLAQYTLNFQPVDKDAGFLSNSLKLSTHFSQKQQCEAYVEKLPALLRSKGYPNSSIDSISYDPASAYCVLYVGETLTNYLIEPDSTSLPFAGIQRKWKKIMNWEEVKQLQEQWLRHLENSGYPFASISLDNVKLAPDTFKATISIKEGPLYKIDSIRNLGRASLSPAFLQQYLGIPNGSIYHRDRLEKVSARIRELPYVQEEQPWNMSLLGTGSVLNLHLDPKKSSEVNVLVGLLPANNQLAGNKMLVTGEATINLKNSLGGGETIGLNWQQIQVKSPRLNILFNQPYLFGSPFGMNFQFDLFKKDSSFVNVGILLGASYAVSATQTSSVFVQRLTTNLLSVDTFRIKTSRKLPAEADVSSVNLGITYDWNTTDYRYNPRKGNEISVTASAGTRNIRRNNIIVKLNDGNDPQFDFNSLYDTFPLKSYQFRVRTKVAHYFPLSRASTLKTAFSGGWFQSPAIFRNELFQIGGYKLLRGFDEESIFSSAYGVATAEYRYLVGQNSFLSAFVDYGVSANHSVAQRSHNSFLGAGLGMAFETRAGIFNITYAAGKRDNQKFNLRQSKIHLGYVNYF